MDLRDLCVHEWCVGVRGRARVLVRAGCCEKAPSWVVEKHQKLVSLRSGGWKPEIRVPAWLGSSENSLTGCRWPTFHGVLMGQKEGKRALRGLVLKDTDPIPEGSALMA